MTITVKGVPVPKPQHLQRGPLWKQPKRVKDYRTWQEIVRWSCAGKIDRSQPSYALALVFYLPTKDVAKRGCRHIGTPDIDNLTKGILDSLFEHDQCVWRILAEKFYDDGHGPRLELQII